MLRIVTLLTVLASVSASELPPEYYRRWFEEVEVLSTPEERRLFESLETDAEREAFLREFWAVRDRHPAVPGNRAREIWDRHHQLVLRHVRDDLRRETLRLLGDPSGRYLIECKLRGQLLLQPIEIWRYPPREEGGQADVLVLFTREGSLRAELRIWSRNDDPAELVTERSRPWQWRGSMLESLERLYKSSPDHAAALKACIEVDREAFVALEEAVSSARTLKEIRSLARITMDPGWTESFERAIASIEPQVRPLPGAVEVRYPGFSAGQPVLEVRLRLDRRALSADRADAPLELASEILHQGQVRGRTRWSLVSDVDSTEPSISVGFLRGVERGSTHLVLRLSDPGSGRHYLSVLPLEPPASGPELPGGYTLPSDVHLLGAGGLDFVLTAHHVEILELEPGPKVERLEVRAAARGPRLAAVEWRLEGEVEAVSESAPYTAVIELGRLPVRQWLEAVAVDREGNVLARDRVLLNGGPNRLALRLVEPSHGSSHRGIVSVRAVADRPAGDSVLRGVDFFVNDRRIAHRATEPFEVEADVGTGLAVIRAVATLDDGRSAEDVVIVNTPDFVERLDVELVELFVSVRDRQGRPVTDLEAEDFEVREEGVAQPLEKFERIGNLPIHVLLAVDSSDSMGRRMPQARKIAEAFLRQVVSPKDQAALLAFNHLPRMLGGFTHDGDRLAEQVAGLDAVGGTALYDSLVYSLFQFGGLNGKRALVLVSDGGDHHSRRYRAEDTVEFAKRAGVAIYTLAVVSAADLPRRYFGSVSYRRHPYIVGLRKLAEVTGGLAFVVVNNKDLAKALGEIEEDLRSQYLLVYASPEGDKRVFREVEVEVLRPGLEARTIRGYFPGGS